MVKRIAAITFIFFCTSVAWLILGATIFARTDSSNLKLSGSVASTWGATQQQEQPGAGYDTKVHRSVENMENGKKITRDVEETLTTPLPLERTRADVQLNLDYRQKGLLWYSTYRVGFTGDYLFRNTSGSDQTINFNFKYPTEKAIYDDFQMTADGAPLTVSNSGGVARASTAVPAGKTVALHVNYRSQGLESWRYSLGSDVTQVRDFALAMHTDFKDIDVPENTLSPTEKHETPAGWDLGWTYRNLVTGFSIEMPMPEKLQPGPLAGQISLFAPVSLFFFFFLMFIITTLRDIELQPMNYFFLAGAFFAFHLLLAYLADHISIHAAFVICSLVSIFLVVSYLRLVVGMRFAAVEAGTAQFVYLVLFSYAFFFKGFTGLSVTIGSILTLFVVMQMTGRIRWAEKFAAKP